MIFRLKSVRVVWREFKERNAFLNRTARDAKKVLSIADGEPTVAFGNVGGDRQRRAIHLIDKKVESSRKRLGELADAVGKVDGFLINKELFKSECHEHERESNESRK